MHVTDVEYAFEENVAEDTPKQMVATGRRVRLYSIVASGRVGTTGTSTTATTKVTFRDGGSSGTTKFVLAMGPFGAGTNQWASIVMNIPEQGVLFLDGINVEVDQEGLEGISITFQV